MRDAFSMYHPIILFLFFGFVIGVTVFVLHPVLLGVSFVCAMAYSIYLNGKKAVKLQLCVLLPLMLIAAVLNPVFNHQGVTILFYVRNNPITMESILYGVAAAVMLGAVILWFACYQAVMTSDKFVYLFGKIIPALSLVVSMALRFVPKYTLQLKKIADAQRCIGKDVSSGSVIARIKNGMLILSIMMTWAFENSIETADSMKARGYGLRGRTAYSNYRFDARDGALFGGMMGLCLVVVAAIASRTLFMRYFASIAMNEFDVLTGLVYAAFIALCALPLLLNYKEDMTWKYLQSKI